MARNDLSHQLPAVGKPLTFQRNGIPFVSRLLELDGSSRTSRRSHTFQNTIDLRGISHTFQKLLSHCSMLLAAQQELRWPSSYPSTARTTIRYGRTPRWCEWGANGSGMTAA